MARDELAMRVAVNSTHGQLDTCVELTHLQKSQLDTCQLDTRSTRHTI